MDRWQWVDAFRKIDVPTATVMNMDEENFKKCCEFLVDSGMAPSSYLPKTNEQKELEKVIEEANRIKSKRGISSYRINHGAASRLNRNEETPDSIGVEKSNASVKDIQDMEYASYVKEEMKKNEEERNNELREMKKTYEDTKKSDLDTKKKREAQELADLLPPEPANGIQIAFSLPNRKRLLRKFEAFDLGSKLYTYIAGQDEMYNAQHNLLDYELKFALNKVVQKEFTLEEQGITNRTLINVIVND